MGDELARGRPRDPAIDERVMETALRHLAEQGYEAMSVVAVADAAETSRQAVYRRWPSKADLATAALARMARATAPEPTGDHLADLVAELEHFRRAVSRPDGLSMVGTMLQRATDPELVRLYRERVVRPRRKRLRAILERAVADGSLDPGADLEVAVAMLTGSWYARALAGEAPPARWPERAASLVWTALGGEG